MEMKDIIPVNWESSNSIIKVVGVGGGGGNAVSQMYQQGIKDVDFMICNTDTMALKNSPVTEKVQLGHSLAKGLGAGCDPERGRAAALESIDQIKESLSGHTEMVFRTAGFASVPPFQSPFTVRTISGSPDTVTVPEAGLGCMIPKTLNEPEVFSPPVPSVRIWLNGTPTWLFNHSESMLILISVKNRSTSCI